MKVDMYGIPNCDTIRKARGWLDEHAIAFEFHKSQLQNSGWMSGNPTLSPFSGWNEMHGGFMDRSSSSEMGQRGEAGRRSRVLQLAHNYKIIKKKAWRQC